MANWKSAKDKLPDLHDDVWEDGNPNDHRFMREAADIVFATLNEALTYIKQLP